MKKRWTVVPVAALSAALAVTCMGCSGGTASSTSAAQTSTEGAVEQVDDTYVDASWLNDNLDDVVVVDARSNDSFVASHIPGAVNLTWQELSNTTKAQPGEKNWATLNSAEDILNAAEAAGIDGTKPIVVYTSVNSGWGEDGRIAWTLGKAGFDDIHILDGGWGKWVGSGYEVASNSRGDIESTDDIESVTEAYVKKHKSEITLVDVRTTSEYDGTIEQTYGESRKGHIPGAVNVPLVSLFNTDGTLKSDEELAQIFEDAGLTDKDAEIVTYCTGGVRAADAAEILKDQGYTNVKVYTASMAEWAGDKSNKVSTK